MWEIICKYVQETFDGDMAQRVKNKLEERFDRLEELIKGRSYY
jgi:hypothetical protein